MSKVVEIARTQLGYSESPSGSNQTKYGAWFGLNGVPWCGIFVSWCFAQAGAALPRMDFWKGFASCQFAYKYFKQNGWLVEKPAAGDIVLFDWQHDGRHDHTGIFVKDLGGGHFQSIEGNTSLANQSNGGQVQLRKRQYRHATFARPQMKK